jgi:hypothetical protein
MKKSQCVLCGEFKATTVEHLPPRSCFPKPRPNNLITVPACDSCNTGRSVLDEELAVNIALIASKANNEGKALWNQRLRTIKHNSRIRKDLIANSRPAIDPSKIIYSINILKCTTVFESVFRGLYFKEFGDIYPQEHKFEIKIRTKLFPEDYDFIDRLYKGEVGAEAFKYGIQRDEENPEATGGILIFYNRVAIIGFAGLPSQQKLV